MAAQGYVGNPDFRGWIAADPAKQWALDFVGNDIKPDGSSGINKNKISEYYQAAPGDPRGDAAYANDAINKIVGYIGDYNKNVLGMSTDTPQMAGRGAGSSAAAEAAAKAAKANALRSNITGLVNTTKDIFNGRYGLVDAAAADQTNNLNKRFTDESSDITGQVTNESEQAGGAFAARGTRDSSDYGNAVDDIKEGGAKQIRTLGQELEDNLGKVGSFAASEKKKFDAEKQGLDAIVSHLAESTDPDELTTIRNQLDAKITELKGGEADYNTGGQNRAALEQIAPSGKRAQQLVTTLQSIVGSSADPGLKKTIAERLVNSAGLNPDEADKLLQQFSGQIDDQEKQQNQ